ncbi:pantothenate kinase [Pacificimonas flava]|uniref:Type III pantothenate kinase n=2 Tax=Pacificimonas TaxID=1960290 RepID=A0A219B6V2_9SPHN|nr:MULTISPECIES: type III pantothenate kinase [Pacificimonas]MBZ6378720.1 type III pantothenate kinase [Pacificimonas aurantium]OWV34011.1 pantothenate kinase [Pacificimonas flava]
MLLAIDVGNTNTVFALLDGGIVRNRWRMSTQASRTADEYLAFLMQHFAIGAIDPTIVERVVISTVVPPVVFNLTKLAGEYFGCSPLFVSKDLDLGIGIDVPNPAEVGADRLVNSAAAFAEHGDDLIVVDFGTATTFDIISGGAYAGGVIAPGINLAVDALYAASAQLPRVSVAPPADGKAWAKGTVNAMQAGIFYGYIGLIEGLVTRIREESARDMLCIATGGLAPIFERHTDIIERVDQDLTVRGLALIADRN